MEQEITKNPLVQILETSGIEKTKGEIVLEKFTTFFQQASEWEAKVKALVITDASQVREMKMAREGRLALRDIRLVAEKTKDKLKEDSIREGRFIQAIYNLIEGTVSPLEKELLEKEKFAENMEKERLAKLQKERAEMIAPYSNPANHYLDGLSDSEFEELFQNLKFGYEARIEAGKKAEQERIEKEKADAAERERIRLENEQLKKEVDEKEKALALERKKAELVRENEITIGKLRVSRFEELLQLGFKYTFDDLGDMTDFTYNKMLTEHKKAFKEKQAEAEKEKAKQDAILAKEREAREKLEAEKIALENKKKAEEKARLDAEKKALKAPDKEKLFNLASIIEAIKVPELKTVDASDIAFYAKKDLDKVVKFIKEQSENL